MTGRPKGKYGQATTQGRISVFAALETAGPQGVETGDLVAVLTAQGLTVRSAKGVLFRLKKESLIWGKGVKLSPTECRYRYFATEHQCAEYVFAGLPTAEERAQRKRETARQRWHEKRVTETQEERDARRQVRNERLRAKMWEKRGFEEPPPKRVVVMTAEERAEMTRRRLEALMANKRAKAEAKRLAKEAAKLPGRRQVVPDDSVAAPVSVRKRELVAGPVDYSKARITVVPVGIDYRYHVDPETVERVFSALPVGRYLEEAGAV
jgi:hypothetical protein